MTPDDGSLTAQEREIRQYIAFCITQLMAKKGIAERKQAAAVAEITGLSVIQARRKLNVGPSWSIEEAMAIATHFGESLNSVFAGRDTGSSSSAMVCDVSIGRARYAGVASLGPSVTTAQPDELVAYRVGPTWQVLPFKQLDAAVGLAEVFKVDTLKLTSQANAALQIAVLDDELSVAFAVRDGLIAEGFSVQAFSSEAMLLPELERFDVFIIDFVLSPLATSTGLIKSIRLAKPEALIMVLTGWAGGDVDAELALQIRMNNVQIHEKPAKLRYLKSTIQAWLDRR